MPWQERSLMDGRLRFVQDVRRPGWSIAEVCRRYQVSRKTGYKWLERYAKAGPAGLDDRSHRPYTCPHATPAPIVQMTRAARFYFATPHHAWERGTNENTNGLVRQYLPKRQSMAHLTQHECHRIAAKLNRRPRKRLGYRTPEECYAR